MKTEEAAKKAADSPVMDDDERRKLVSTEQSLSMPAEPKIPAAIEGLESFSLREDEPVDTSEDDFSDADSFFNLPEGDQPEVDD